MSCPAQAGALSPVPGAQCYQAVLILSILLILLRSSRTCRSHTLEGIQNRIFPAHIPQGVSPMGPALTGG